MNNNDKEFEKIVQSIKNDEQFIRQTGKISKRFTGARALTLGIIMTIVGVCMVPTSLALLNGFWGLTAGVLSFGLSLWGAMITHGAWGTAGQAKNNSGQSSFMQKANRIWDKHIEEQGR